MGHNFRTVNLWNTLTRGLGRTYIFYRIKNVLLQICKVSCDKRNLFMFYKCNKSLITVNDSLKNLFSVSQQPNVVSKYPNLSSNFCEKSVMVWNLRYLNIAVCVYGICAARHYKFVESQFLQRISSCSFNMPIYRIHAKTNYI